MCSAIAEFVFISARTFFSGIDHGDRRPVLAAATGIRGLELRHDGTRDVATHLAEADHRRVADQVEHGVGHIEIVEAHEDILGHLEPEVSKSDQIGRIFSARFSWTGQLSR